MLINSSIFKIIKGRRIYFTAENFFDYILYFLIFIFAILALRYQYFLLNYMEWVDESETIVAAKMMAAGMKLYSEVFNHHGPLTFLPGLLVEKFGSFGVSEHRVPIAFLQILSVLSIYKLPVLNTTSQRAFASIACAVVILLFMPNILGHAYKYQTIAGIFLVVIISQYTLPAILCSEKLTRTRVVLGNVLIVSLPFLAVTYLPVAGLLFLASYQNRYFRSIVISCSLGLFANIFFLGAYGSFAGFFAFHLYLNAKVLPLYTGLQPGWQLIINAFTVATSDLAHFFSIIIIFVASIILAQRENFIPWRTLLLIAGLFSLLMRGAGFHGMPYFYAILPLLALTLFRIDMSSRSIMSITLIFILLCIVKISLVFPEDKSKLNSKLIPTETEFSILVNEFTNKEDKIIAYSFQNFQYIASDRLPASGHFFYLPWQEKYNENPKYGVLIDACKQIRASKPKVMLIDKWMVWDRFSWDSYASCIQEILDLEYLQVPNRPYYIRKDLISGFDAYVLSKNQKMVPSSPLSNVMPIQININKYLSDIAEQKKLVGVGILFGTYMRINSGVAELVIKREDDENVHISFSLPELQDNEYRYFDVPEGIYTSGEIVSLSGKGISTWESHSPDNTVSTCIKFVYSDNSRGYTPGCPML